MSRIASADTSVAGFKDHFFGDRPDCTEPVFLDLVAAESEDVQSILRSAGYVADCKVNIATRQRAAHLIETCLNGSGIGARHEDSTDPIEGGDAFRLAYIIHLTTPECATSELAQRETIAAMAEQIAENLPDIAIDAMFKTSVRFA